MFYVNISISLFQGLFWYFWSALVQWSFVSLGKYVSGSKWPRPWWGRWSRRILEMWKRIGFRNGTEIWRELWAYYAVKQDRMHFPPEIKIFNNCKHVLFKLQTVFYKRITIHIISTDLHMFSHLMTANESYLKALVPLLRSIQL